MFWCGVPGPLLTFIKKHSDYFGYIDKKDLVVYRAPLTSTQEAGEQGSGIRQNLLFLILGYLLLLIVVLRVVVAAAA